MELDEEMTDVCAESPYTILQSLRVKNIDKISLGHINLNSIKNKFHTIADLIKGKIDILLIGETKIDSTFPNSQFEIHGYTSPFRFDRSKVGGGLLFYTRQDIPTRMLPSQHFGNIECIILEINISNKDHII